MKLNELVLKPIYESENTGEISQFVENCLRVSDEYNRAIGFFSSTALLNYFEGLKQFLLSGGKMKLIVSPKLSAEDIQAIKEGHKYLIKEVEINVFDVLEELETTNIKACNLLSALIKNKLLEIKIALNSSTYGMFHEKIGYFSDGKDYISFTGSLNESENSYTNNYESINVFKSWNQYDEHAKANKDIFDRHWAKKTNKLVILDLSEAIKDEIFNKYHDYEELKKLIEDYYDERTKPEKKLNSPFRNPDWFEPRSYQIDAYKKWKDNKYHGIFEMATGTGKTLTALNAVATLWEDENLNNLFAVVVVPYMILVNQWTADLSQFTDEIIRVSSEYPEWSKSLQGKIGPLNRGKINILVAVTTIMSYKSDKFQKAIQRIGNNVNTLIIADECHNIGAGAARKNLNYDYKYRLGLSATPSRFEDEEGTEFLFKYFGGVVYEYNLEEAIRNDNLVHYNYYPILVKLTEDETKDYNILSSQIEKLLNGKDEDTYNKYIPPEAKSKIIERARLISGANDKIRAVGDVIRELGDKKHILVYCGSSYVYKIDDDEDIEENENKSLTQINAVCDLISNQFDKYPARYTSQESTIEREKALERFKSGTYEYLVAIKCLDEGVNIPEIETAIIVASTRNPKEFVQRRGRVLRKCDDINKQSANIYDLIVLPSDHSEKSENFNHQLVIKEMKRFQEFSELADNIRDLIAFKQEIYNKYNINEGEIIDV